MRNLDTPVKQIRRKIFTEIAKIGFESTDESMIHDIESIPYNIVEERAKYRESIYRERAVAANVSVWPWDFPSARKIVPSTLPMA